MLKSAGFPTPASWSAALKAKCRSKKAARKPNPAARSEDDMTNLSPEAKAQLVKLATDLAHNPKTRKQFVGLVKEIDPTRRFPDVEADEIREEMTREFEKRDAARAQKEAL